MWQTTEFFKKNQVMQMTYTMKQNLSLKLKNLKNINFNLKKRKSHVQFNATTLIFTRQTAS